MKYNLRPRRASVVLRGADLPETCRLGRDKTQLNGVCTQEKEGTQIGTNDCSLLETDPLRRVNHCPTTSLVPTDEDVPQEKQSTNPFSTGGHGFPSEPVVDAVAEQRHYSQQTLSKRTRHNLTTQHTASGQMVDGPVEYAVRSPEVSNLDRTMPTAYFPAKDSPPHARKDSEILAIRPQPKTHSSANIRSTPHYVPNTFTCHPLLLPPSVGTRPTSDSVRKAVGVCHSEQLQTSCSPRLRLHFDSATAVPAPHFRAPGTAPQTPARSKTSSELYAKEMGQGGSSGFDRKYSTTALRNNGETESTRLLVLLSSSTITTPSASRGRKRKRQSSKSGGVSYKKKGLSPQSPSIRTRTTASTVPSLSDLASPPCILPLASPATERQQDCATVSLTAAELTPAAQLYDGKPPHATPPVLVEHANEVLPSTKQSEGLSDNTFNPDPPFADGNLSSVKSSLKHIPPKRVTSTGYGGVHTAVDPLRLRRHAPDAACTTHFETSSAAAVPEPPVRLSDKARSISTVSPSCSASTTATVYRRPLRVRWKGRRTGTQPSVSFQQGEGTQQESMLSISRTLPQTRSGESYGTLPAAAQPGSLRVSSPSSAACDARANEAIEPSNAVPAERRERWLSNDAECQQRYAGGSDVTVTRVTASRSCPRLHSSPTLEMCNPKREPLPEEKKLPQDTSMTVKRLQQASNFKQIRSRPAADSGCRALHAKCDEPSGTAQLEASPCFRLSARHCLVLTRQDTLACQCPSGTHAFSSSSCLLRACGKSLLFRSLPPVILCRVLRFLPLSSLAAFGATCTYAQELLRLPATWKYMDERSVGRWMRQHDRLTFSSPACPHSEHKQGDAVPSKAEVSRTTTQQISRDIAAAAEPFACLSRISVDLTYARGLSQMRSVSQALFNLPTAALLRFTPAQIGRAGGGQVATVGEGDGIRRTAQNAAAPAAPAVAHTFSRLSCRSASPSTRSSAFHQYSSQLGENARPSGSTINRSNDAGSLQQVQSVSEERPISQPTCRGTRWSAAQRDGTVDWQRHRTTLAHGVADGPSEPHAGAQAEQQASEGSLACDRGGERSNSSVQQQRERLRRALTFLLSSHVATSNPGGGLAVTSRGLHSQSIYANRSICANREFPGFPSRSAAEAGLRHIHASQPDEGAPSPGARAAPSSVLTSERQGLRSHAAVEEDSFPVREIRRRATVDPTGSQLPTLLQNLYAQVAAPEGFFQAWSRERQHFISQIQTRGVTVVPTTQQQESFDHTSPFNGFTFGTHQPLDTREESDLDSQPVSEAEQTAGEWRRESQTVSLSGNEHGPIAQVSRGSGRTCEQLRGPETVSRRDRQRLFFLHQLVLRLQQSQQLSDGFHLSETAVLIPRALTRQNLSSNPPSASEEATIVDEEGCTQRSERSGLAHEVPSSPQRPQNEVDMPEPRARQAQQQLRVEIAGQRNRSERPICRVEVSGQSVQRLYRASACLSPVDAVHAEGATNTSTGHSQPLRIVPRILVPTQMDQQCVIRTEQVHFDHSQLGVRSSACALPYQPLVTASQSRTGTQEGAPSSEQPAGDSFHSLVEERSTTHAGDATENSGADFRKSSVAKEGDTKDAQRLRILRSLLVHMQQLVQINFRLEARELNRLQRLREEVLVVTSLLRQNAKTLRLIKISVDLIAVEGGAEEVINRNLESRNAAKTSVTLPLLELPHCLPALQVFHTDYPFQVPSGFSASPSFTQLCVRALHRFLSPFFTTAPEPTQPTRKSASTPSSDRSRSTPQAGTSSADGSVTERGERVRGDYAEQRMYTVYGSQRHVATDKRVDVNYKKQCTTQATAQAGEKTYTCAPPEQAHQRSVGDVSRGGQFSCFSPRTRPRQKQVSQVGRDDRREQHTVLSLRSSHPLRCRRVSLPDSFTPTSKRGFSADHERKKHGGLHVDTEAEAGFEEMTEAQTGLRRRHVLKLVDLGLSPCHTLSPQSDIALSLQSSPSGETREDLLKQLRVAFTERIAKDTRGNEAQADCDGKNELSKEAPRSPSLGRLDVRLMATCNDSVFSSPPTIPISGKPDDKCYSNSKKAPAVSDDAPIGNSSRGNRERARHEALPRTPLANLQRLLHIGRETLQQVDLQGDPPRTFCCLHSRLKFSKLMRLSLGWTCTAELVLLHSMLLKGHLPQLRKLQFSGPSGGSGLSMMHLQLYALLNSPPSACPHHPPVPLPETISLTPSTSSDVANLPPLPSTSVIVGASADFKRRDRFCEASRQPRTPSQSEDSSEQLETLPTTPRTGKVATVTAFLRDDEMRLQEMQCVSNVGGSVQRQQRSAESNSRVTKLYADHAVAADDEHVAQKDILVEQTISRKRADACAGEVDGQLRGSVGAAVACEKQGHTQECQQHDSNETSAAPTTLQHLNKNKRGVSTKRRSLHLLACTLASAKKMSTLGCERCAAMRGGTAHGVYFKYAALDIDFAALVEFRLALQRHGLFAFYKDERNKLNLLHVEGLTDVAGRDSLEEEKSLENRLERKNEWKRRFAYLHIQSPPFSFSSSSQSSSRHEPPHSRTDAPPLDAALWSVAPLPLRRVVSSESPSTVPCGPLNTGWRSSHTELMRPTLRNHHAVSETRRRERETMNSGPYLPSESSTARAQRSPGSARSARSTSTVQPLGVTPVYLATDSGRFRAAAAAATAEEQAPTTTPTNRGAQPSLDSSLDLTEVTLSSNSFGRRNFRGTNGDLLADQTPCERTGTGSRAGNRLELSRAPLLPRGEPAQNTERSDFELQTEQNPHASGCSKRPTSSALDHQEKPNLSHCTSAHVGTCPCLNQETVRGDAAMRIRYSQEQRHHTRNGFTLSSSAGVTRSSREAAHCRGNSGEMCVARGDCEDASHCGTKDRNDCSLNCSGEGIALAGPEVRRGSHGAESESDTCRTTLTTQEGGEPRSGNEATATCSQRAARPPASQPHNTDESSARGLCVSDEGETGPPPCQNRHSAQSHNQPRRQQRHPPQTGGAPPKNAPLRRQSGENDNHQAAAGRETGRLLKTDRSRTPYFPEVCPLMSGRDLFILEMWLAPELCRDLQSAPNLSQLSKQLTYLWEHKLTAQQRAVYNDVIVKRYVQERQGVQEWNFDAAKAWWMGG